MKRLLLAFLLCSAFGFAQTTCVNCSGTVYTSGGTTVNVIPKSNGNSVLVDSDLTDVAATSLTSGVLFIPPATSSATVVGGIGTASNGSGINFQPTSLQFMQSAQRAGAFNGLDFALAQNAKIGWSGTATDAMGSSEDTFIGKRSAANVRFGAADLNGSPVAQTFSVQNAITGSNLAGAQFTLTGSLGTGTALPAPVVIQGADASVATGTTAQTAINRLAVGDTKNLTTGAATTLISIPLATLQMAGGYIEVYMEATDGTNQCTRSEEVYYSAENSAGVFVTSASVVGTGVTACTAAKTLTASYALTSANPALLQVTPTLTGITATRFTAIYEVHHMGNTNPTL